MKSKASKSALFIFILVQSLGCFSGVKKYTPPTFYQEIDKYKHFFNPEIKPLKKQLSELYFYLKRGHIYKHINENAYIYSPKIIEFIRANRSNFINVPYLQEYSNFIKVFGEPHGISEGDKTFLVYYVGLTLGSIDSNQEMFAFTFDQETKKLLLGYPH
ncbi:MAG: hypothetical protein R2879_16300 [Saprospiraceae bacterium]